MKQMLFTLILAISFGVALSTIAMNNPQENELIRALLDQTDRRRNLSEMDIQINFNKITRSIAAGAKVNSHLAHAATMYAVRNNKTKECALFFEHGVDVNHHDPEEGTTYLMCAVEHGLTPTVDLLLNHGAHVNARNKNNDTALIRIIRRHWSSSEDTKCQMLLENGALINIQNNYGDTALHGAAKYNHDSTCHLLINHQKNINAATKTLLLCLYRMRRNGENAQVRLCSSELYHQFRTLLLPYFGPYVRIQQLLNIRNNQGKQAYDYLKLECLNPEPNAGSFSNCSIQ